MILPPSFPDDMTTDKLNLVLLLEDFKAAEVGDCRGFKKNPFPWRGHQLDYMWYKYNYYLFHY